MGVEALIFIGEIALCLVIFS